MSEETLGGRFTFPGTSLPVQRIGYGAMQLAGPGVWGPVVRHNPVHSESLTFSPLPVRLIRDG